MNWISYSWTALINLITLGVVIGIFSSLYESFEIIVVSLLVLIYLSLQTFAMSFGQIQINNTFLFAQQFRRVRQLIQKDNLNSYEEDAEKEETKEAKDKADKLTIKMYINAGFAFIFYIIALWNLFGAL